MSEDITKIEFDKEGFMMKPELWNADVASTIAKDEGIEAMDETQWKVVNFIREYWKENDMAPAVRLTVSYTHLTLPTN